MTRSEHLRTQPRDRKRIFQLGPEAMLAVKDIILGRPQKYFEEESLPYARARSYAAEAIFDSLYQAASSPHGDVFPFTWSEESSHLDVVGVMRRLPLLLGPRADRQSTFMADPLIVQTRLRTIDHVLPIISTLLTNQKADLTQEELHTLAGWINNLAENELFGVDEPIQYISDRVDLASDIITIAQQLVKHPRTDQTTPVMAELSILCACRFSKFTGDQKTQILKEAVPVLTAILSGKDLTVDQRFSLAGEIICALDVIVKGKKKLTETDIKEIYTTLRTAAFTEGFTDEQTYQLWLQALSIITELAKQI